MTKQMRTNHRIEDKTTEKPLIDIHVMAALPSRECNNGRIGAIKVAQVPD